MSLLAKIKVKGHIHGKWPEERETQLADQPIDGWELIKLGSIATIVFVAISAKSWQSV
jgi:hypothetical protein